MTRVRPARAGMSPVREDVDVDDPRPPRASGDEPTSSGAYAIASWSAPRERG